MSHITIVVVVTGVFRQDPHFWLKYEADTLYITTTLTRPSQKLVWGSIVAAPYTHRSRLLPLITQ